MNVLQIIETAYRATLEEQDDTVLWATTAMAGAGGSFSVLLRGPAVNYAVTGQDASGLAFGEWTQTHPPAIEADLARLMGKDAPIYVVEEDLTRRGLRKADCAPGIRFLPQRKIAALINAHDQTWLW
jgi:hypothetical protein